MFWICGFGMDLYRLLGFCGGSVDLPTWLRPSKLGLTLVSANWEQRNSLVRNYAIVALGQDKELSYFRGQNVICRSNNLLQLGRDLLHMVAKMLLASSCW